MTEATPQSTRIAVVIPVHDGADRIGATVAAAAAIPGVARVVVVDDGSTDDSATRAAAGGAEVVRLDENGGKAGAVRAGIDACPDADVLLLLDADLGATAAGAAPLLGPVVGGDVDMTVGVLPGAGRRGGFGLVRRLARWGVRRGCGFDAGAPLSGQRAVRRSQLDALGSVERFGLEVALTVDLVRAGARIVEVEIDVDHAHTGRRLAGFRHRARQGADIGRALWPRLTTASTRIALVVAASVVFVATSLALSSGTDVGRPLPGPPDQVDRVVVVGIPRLGLDDVERMPTLDRLGREGALAATNVRTGGDTPRPWAAYATVSAGVRVDGVDVARSVRRSGADIEVGSMAAARRGTGRYVTSEPGAVGSALHRAGRRTAVLTSGSPASAPPGSNPSTGAALVAADARGHVDEGEIDRAAFVDRSGMTDPSAVAERTVTLLESADLVVVDTGDTTGAAVDDEAARRAALATTDAALAAIVDRAPRGTLVLVVGVTPPTGEWALTPTVAWGAGVSGHRLASPTARRPDLVTLIDIGPTVLSALGVERPAGMTGQALRQRSGTVDRARLERLDEVARGREATYFRMTITFIFVQALVQLVTWMLLVAGRLRPGAARAVRALTLVCAAWPLATYLVRAVPVLMTLGAGTHVAPWPVAAVVALVASRARRHPLAPLAVIAAATAGLIVADLATGAHLQVASVLGTAPHTTYRFNGLGNVGFAVLASAAVIAVAIHVDVAPRRREALVTAACALGIVGIADVAPWMGADVGGVLTLVPVYGLALVVLTGRRLRVRTVLLAAALGLIGFAVVLGLDLLRPPEARTHLARFVTEAVADGDLGETAGRRWAANTRMFTQSAWTWTVAPLAAAFAWAIARSERLRALAPMAPATRTGVLAALAVGVFGWLLNDSGVVVTALVLIFVPAVLATVAVTRLAGAAGPVPTPPGARPTTGAAVAPDAAPAPAGATGGAR